MTTPAVAVTGIGIVNPCGTGTEPFFRAVLAGKPAITPLTRFNHTLSPAHVAGQIHAFPAHEFMTARQCAQTGPLAQFALAAAAMALSDAGLEAAAHDPLRCGVSLGIGSGSWSDLENGLDSLYRTSAPAMGRSVGTGWFAGAALGQISIRHALRGFSRTYAAGRASGASAVHQAVRSILSGRNDVVLAGGSEASLTPLGIAFHGAADSLAPSHDPATAYLPFDRQRTGTVLGEGSTILVLESAGHARQRGARIYGTIESSAMATTTPAADGTATALTASLTQAGLAPPQIGAVFPESCGTPHGDQNEAHAIRTALGTAAPATPLCTPKSLYGHLQGASFPTELACALLALRHGELPPCAPALVPDPALGITLVTQRQPLRSGTAAVLAHSHEGLSFAVTVRAPLTAPKEQK
ncbi:beta-ketoacyl synthase N-terminal-like domain-containing protein [Streptomyces sp. NPDC008121]|uniref:beta-ketoacyl-[acyl-carrier-protein] synthase family protein n=1 Tax=Streptomyces sp. NPDC008121 TaxID=3364809 RepID=UPI0036ECF290